MLEKTHAYLCIYLNMYICFWTFYDHGHWLTSWSMYSNAHIDQRKLYPLFWKLTIWNNGQYTAVLPQNRSFDSVWSKIGTLQDCIVLCKSAATPLPTLWFLTTNESFQMRYCMNFFFKGHQNCQKSNLKVHEKSCFIKWIWKAKTLTSGHSDAPWGKSSYSTSFESSH